MFYPCEQAYILQGNKSMRLMTLVIVTGGFQPLSQRHDSGRSPPARDGGEFSSRNLLWISNILVSVGHRSHGAVCVSVTMGCR